MPQKRFQKIKTNSDITSTQLRRISNGTMGIPVAGYCRVSTSNQKEEGTIELQRIAIREYCNGRYYLREIFCDEGVSGGLEDRPALASLFEYLENNPEVKNVVIWKLDRIARDLYIQEHLIKKLGSIGVTLISLKEPNLDSSDPIRVAFRQFIGIVSELEKNFITMRLTEGRKAKFRRSGYAGGGVAYGYKVIDNDLVIDNEQSIIVKEIFRMRRNQHLSFRAIASDLNRRGVPTRTGKIWEPATVHYLLRNPLYRGLVKYSGDSATRSDLKLIK